MYDKLALVALILTLGACEGTIDVPLFDPETGEQYDTNFPTPTGGAAANHPGEPLYDTHCSTCHGPAGTGAAAWPESIVGFQPIAKIVQNGQGSMPPVPISTPEIEKIQGYLLALAEEPEPPGGQVAAPAGQPAPADEPASAASLPGKPLYDSHCSACHGPAGAGAAVWPEAIAGFEPIADIVQNGQGAMAPVDITPDQTTEIQEYLIALVAHPDDAPEPEPVDISDLSGVEVYELRCAACHGDEGQGTDLGYQLQYRADDYSKFVVVNGRPSTDFESDMPAYDDISEGQLDEMFDWLGSFPNPDDGKGLYDRYCANCHGDDARGGPTGKKIASKSESTGPIRDGENLDAMDNRREFMPRWGTDVLSVEEVDAINAYVGSLPD